MMTNVADNRAGVPMESQDEVLVDREDGVLVITINRPHARNSVTRSASEGIARALDELDVDRDLTVGIITGAGGNFCAGMDLKAFAARGEDPSLPGRGFVGLTEALPRKPLIAAVEGYALAGGCEVVLACDLVVAGQGAKLGIPEVKRGLTAAAGGLHRLPERIPRNVAMELALTGDMMTAERAYQLGLVNEVTEDGQALIAAKALAARIGGNGPLAIVASKRVIVDYPTWSTAEIWERQREITDVINASADAKEGARAFAEKRPPRWQGR
ncbi:crotonase/enoyl-CoA hydratase family protein [Brevibacterium spongiae]|uniref:Crotonase/enoyl-CoA hydratase family protein n=1 Tax=Brevibacterium spongiae TaxID=2909672 RepID=A0ABY5STR5_9MICO|nr:crotonase/enoyl-CoA hydratase family protein [Brevibacterium spongiae]UVI36426.1 crotonase/enoyl-CoA hydratase family protein [Brevibacterium spongiae]